MTQINIAMLGAGAGRSTFVNRCCNGTIERSPKGHSITHKGVNMTFQETEKSDLILFDAILLFVDTETPASWDAARSKLSELEEMWPGKFVAAVLSKYSIQKQTSAEYQRLFSLFRRRDARQTIFTVNSLSLYNYVQVLDTLATDS